MSLHFFTVWMRVCVTIAAIGTTAVPLIYSFAPWRSRLLGKLFMLQAVAFALAMDLRAVYTYYSPPNRTVEFWVKALIYTFIAIATFSLAILMWILGHPPKGKRKGKHGA